MESWSRPTKSCQSQAAIGKVSLGELHSSFASVSFVVAVLSFDCWAFSVVLLSFQYCCATSSVGVAKDFTVHTHTRKMRGRLFILGTSALLICLLTEFAESSCDSNRLRQGCRIQEGSCLCGTGCDTDYRYSNKRECEAALRGRSQDPCYSNPCRNRGVCLQVFNNRKGYSCLCSGTNYYGDLCETRCPRRSRLAPGQRMPLDCIVI